MATATETDVIIDGPGTYWTIDGERCIVVGTKDGYWLVFIKSKSTQCVWRYMSDGIHRDWYLPRIVKKLSDGIDL